MNIQQFSLLTTLLFLISFSAQAQEGLLLRQQLNEPFPQSTNALVVNLYASKDAFDPVAQQTFFPGEWQLLQQRHAAMLSVSFTELPLTEHPDSLWMEMLADGKPLGPHRGSGCQHAGSHLCFRQ